MKKPFGEMIRELRETKDMTLREFARKIGVSAAFISDIELGRRYPSQEYLEKMADALGVTVKKLKEYDSRPPLAELRKLSAKDPAYGFAFRRIVDENISPDELLRLIQKAKDEKGGQ